MLIKYRAKYEQHIVNTLMTEIQDVNDNSIVVDRYSNEERKNRLCVFCLCHPFKGETNNVAELEYRIDLWKKGNKYYYEAVIVQLFDDDNITIYAVNDVELCDTNRGFEDLKQRIKYLITEIYNYAVIDNKDFIVALTDNNATVCQSCGKILAPNQVKTTINGTKLCEDCYTSYVVYGMQKKGLTL